MSRIRIEPLLRSIRPSRCQICRCLLTLSRLPPAKWASSRWENEDRLTSPELRAGWHPRRVAAGLLQFATSRCRNSTSSTCSVVWRNLWQSTLSRMRQISARFSKIGIKSLRCSTNNSQAVIATASVDRAPPSSNAISPKQSPGFIKLKMASFPSEETELILRVPRNTAIMLDPGEPFEKISLPAE